MTTIREKITVMQAFCDGMECEFRECNTNKVETWYALINSSNDSLVSPSWNWARYEYRIKPKPREALLIVDGRGDIVGQVTTNGEPMTKDPLFITGRAVLFREVIQE